MRVQRPARNFPDSGDRNCLEARHSVQCARFCLDWFTLTPFQAHHQTLLALP